MSDEPHANENESQANENRPLAPEDGLARLARRANEAHNRVAESLQQAVANALEVGTALLEAKEICGEGKFTAWFRASFTGKLSLSTARGYMRLVANWNQLGGDLQRAGGFSQRQLTKLLKGLPCSDGRANPRLSAANRLPAPTDAPVGQLSSATHDAPAATAGGDPMEPVGRLLEQVIAELRRVSRGGAAEAPYARHLLKPLEQIRLGISARQWFWELMPT